MIKLTQESRCLLKKCLEEREPDLIDEIERDYTDNYSDDFYNHLREIVGDELIEKGFNEKYEVNEYGILLEKLIDEIGGLFLYK